MFRTKLSVTSSLKKYIDFEPFFRKVVLYSITGELYEDRSGPDCISWHGNLLLIDVTSVHLFNKGYSTI